MGPPQFRGWRATQPKRVQGPLHIQVDVPAVMAPPSVALPALAEVQRHLDEVAASYEAGQVDGIRQADQRHAAESEAAKSALAALSPLAEGLADARAAAVREAELQVARLVTRLTERIVGVAFADPKVVAALASGAVARLQQRGEIVVEVAPAALDAVRLALGADIRIIANEDIQGARVLADPVTIDATAATAIAAVDAAVDAWLASR